MHDTDPFRRTFVEIVRHSSCLFMCLWNQGRRAKINLGAVRSGDWVKEKASSCEKKTKANFDMCYAVF